MQANPKLRELVDPRLIEGLALEVQAPLPVAEQSTIEELHTVMSAAEAENDKIGEQLLASKSRPQDVVKETVVIHGPDGNEISLHFSQSTKVQPDQPRECVVYIHGGGMAIYSAASPFSSHYTADLASTLGATVVAVEYRNSSGKLGRHPFPAGLHDCKAALQWIHSLRETRNFGKIILCGESGGANLSIAVALLLKSEGQLSIIDGLCVLCPFISGLYAATETEESKLLPSLRELDHCGIIDLNLSNIFAKLYDPDGQNSHNPLAWPHWATVEDLRGFPPTAVSLNEADLLLDEGLVFYRKLLKAGVKTRCRTVNGTPHAGDLLGMVATPDLYRAVLYDIKAFINGL